MTKLNRLFSLFAFTSLTLASSLISSRTALSLDFNLDSNVGDDYLFTVTLDSDDSLEVGDQLILTNLSGVTIATASNPYDLVGFDTTSANFSVNTNTSGAITLNQVIQLESPDSLDNINYQIFFTDNGTPSFDSGSITPTAVPFGVAPNLGIVLVVSFFGLRYLKSKFNS
ncbi:MAG: hypothetical protein AAGA80_26230 [Cyanobacteria bacterium P01_F01_bin.143]